MDDFNLDIISTGSIGNAVFLNGQVLIDCGVPFSKLAEAKVVDKVKYIFLTHQHKDHLNVAALQKIISAHPAVKIIYPDYLCKILSERFHNNSFFNSSFFADINKWYTIGNIIFSCVPLHHDVPNVAWKIHFKLPQGIYKIIYATDTGAMDGVTAKNYDLFLIEANYSKAELIKRLNEKRKTGQYVYEDRVLRTHLSQEQADEWICSNAGYNSRYVYLHEHKG